MQELSECSFSMFFCYSTRTQSAEHVTGLPCDSIQLFVEFNQLRLIFWNPRRKQEFVFFEVSMKQVFFEVTILTGFSKSFLRKIII
jgi:hypothetical protein